MRALRDAEEGNSDSAADAMKVAEGFFHKLLCPWMEPFCNDIVRGAQTDYARGLAAFTMGIVELETGLLSFKMSTNL